MSEPFPAGANPPPALIADDRKDRVQAALDARLGSVVVVCEAVHRRHNVSAILRSAECFGAHEVHLVMGEFRPSRGAARGAERWLELHLQPDTTSCLLGLKARGFKVYVADLAEPSWSPDTLPVDGPVAVLFGSELDGVSDEARALADGAIQVPMRGLTESLNVSVAAACVLQRVTERRRQVVGGGDLEPERREAFYQAWLDAEEAAKAGRRARLGLDGEPAEDQDADADADADAD